MSYAEQPRWPTRPRSPVTLANEQVAITAACRLIGMDLPDDVGYGRSVKLRCPFGDLYHRDGGAEASFRVYPDSNSAYCFACSATYSPVWLVAQAWGITPRAAAVELLERAGIKPVSLAHAWAQAATRDTAPDLTLLAEALKTFCARIATERGIDWLDAQYTAPVPGLLNRCLALLDQVRTDAEAAQWLAGCKQVMAATLQRPTVYLHQRPP